MKPLAVLFCGSVAGILFLLVRSAGHVDSPPRAGAELRDDERIDASVERVNEWFRRHWEREGVQRAASADDLTVFRRLSLALHGTIPSLEEVRSFVSDTSDDRIERWLLKILQDERFANYFSERLTRMLVGNEEGQFVIYRRDRLGDWLAEQLRKDRPWSESVRQLIAGDGLWTESGFANFITAAFVDGEGLNENKLAGKTVRSFLGQRIDCAQCHDHPFDDWKQSDFEGLAAFYGQARVTPGGVVDRRTEEGEPIGYEVIDPGSEEGRIVEPRAPFHEEWLIPEGSRREQLASWIIHPENGRFGRAAANRIWGLLFGRAFSEPVDDLRDPGDEEDLLDILAEEFRAHDHSLHFLVCVIVQSDVFRLRSDVPESADDDYESMDANWAVFPLVRLRPEQVIGSMFQAGNILTIDQNSHVFTRFARFLNENDFLKQYGEIADDELLRQTGTIPQALLRMNGRFTRNLTQAELLTSAGQILSFSDADEATIDNSFLTCLTRLPTWDEQTFFARRLAGGGNRMPGQERADEEPLDNSTDLAGSDSSEGTPEELRKRAVEDLFWVLFNSPEFSWNH